MPLPPAPTKRAALLPPEAYDAPARSSHKAPRKSEANHAGGPLPERPQALDFEPRLGGGDMEHAESLLHEEPEEYEDFVPPTLKKKPAAPVQPALRTKKARSTGPSKPFV